MHLPLRKTVTDMGHSSLPFSFCSVSSVGARLYTQGTGHYRRRGVGFPRNAVLLERGVFCSITMERGGVELGGKCEHGHLVGSQKEMNGLDFL